MRKFLKNCLLCLLSISIFFIILEVYLRIFLPIYSPITKVKRASIPFLEYNSKLGWFNKKGINTYFDMQEFSTAIMTNGQGLRNKEYGYNKAPGVKRILILGDSFAFGFGVNNSEVFSQRLEEIGSRNGKKIEIINTGVEGYGTAQEFLLLEEEGIKYNPDVVICLFYAGNDIQNNSCDYEYGKHKPVFILKNEQLVLKNSPVLTDDSAALGEKTNEDEGGPKLRIKIPFIKELLQRHSYAYVFLRLRYNYLLYKLKIRKDIYFDKISDGWNITKEILKKMDRFCNDRGVTFIIMAIPTKEQMLSGGSQEIQDGLQSFTRSNNIEYVDLLPFFKGRRDLNFIIDSHWNQKGHQFIAAIIYSYLEKMKKI